MIVTAAIAFYAIVRGCLMVWGAPGTPSSDTEKWPIGSYRSWSGVFNVLWGIGVLIMIVIFWE
jgi:hypothetical protein